MTNAKVRTMLSPGGAWYNCGEAYLRARFMEFIDAAPALPAGLHPLFGAALDNLEAGNVAGATRDLRRAIATYPAALPAGLPDVDLLRERIEALPRYAMAQYATDEPYPNDDGWILARRDVLAALEGSATLTHEPHTHPQQDDGWEHK